MHLPGDGSRPWFRSLQDTGTSYKGSGPICDVDSNVYLTRGGSVLSYSETGKLRWEIEVADYTLYIGPMDSQGMIYCRSWYEDTASRFFAIGDGPPHRSRVRAKFADGAETAEYQAGHELVVLLQPYNFGDDQRVDAYLAIVAPDGSVLYFDGSGFSGSPTPWFTDVFMPNSFEMIDAAVSLGTIPHGLPAGTYTIIPAFTEPGTLNPTDELFSIRFDLVTGR